MRAAVLSLSYTSIIGAPLREGGIHRQGGTNWRGRACSCAKQHHRNHNRRNKRERYEDDSHVDKHGPGHVNVKRKGPVILRHSKPPAPTSRPPPIKPYLRDALRL